MIVLQAIANTIIAIFLGLFAFILAEADNNMPVSPVISLGLSLVLLFIAVFNADDNNQTHRIKYYYILFVCFNGCIISDYLTQIQFRFTNINIELRFIGSTAAMIGVAGLFNWHKSAIKYNYFKYLQISSMYSIILWGIYLSSNVANFPYIVFKLYFFFSLISYLRIIATRRHDEDR